jgi:hypothetical protein
MNQLITFHAPCSLPLERATVLCGNPVTAFYSCVCFHTETDKYASRIDTEAAQMFTEEIRYLQRRKYGADVCLT